PFTTTTNYRVFLTLPNGNMREIRSFTSENAPNPNSREFFTIRTRLIIPSEFIGTGYTIDVRSTNPNATSIPPSPLSLTYPTLNVTGTTNICAGGTFNLTGTVTGAGDKTVVLRDVNNNFLSSVPVPENFTFSRTINSTTPYNF